MGQDDLYDADGDACGSVPSQSQQPAKRPRNEPPPTEDDGVAKWLDDLLLTRVSTVAPEGIKTLRNKVSSLHKRWLEKRRAIKVIEQNIADERAPRPFSSNADKVTLGKGAESLRPELDKAQLTSDLGHLRTILKARKMEAEALETDKNAVIDEILERCMARFQRISLLAPLAHNMVDTEDVKAAVVQQLQHEVADT